MGHSKDASPQSRLATELSRLRSRRIDGTYPQSGEGDPSDLGLLFQTIRSLYPGMGPDRSDMIASIKLGVKAAAAALPPGKHPSLRKDCPVTRESAALMLYGLYPFPREARETIDNYELPYQTYAKWAKYLREQCGLPEGSSVFKRFTNDIITALANTFLQAEKAGGFDKLTDEQASTPEFQFTKMFSQSEPMADNLPAKVETPMSNSHQNTEPETDGPDQNSQTRSQDDPPPTNRFEDKVTQVVIGGLHQASGAIGGNVIHHHYAAPPPNTPPRSPGSTATDSDR